MSFQITSTATKKALVLMEKENKSGYVLRIGVQGGGCSDFSYILRFDEAPKESDTIVEQDGLTVVCDPKSLQYLGDITIDYETNLLKQGFKFYNPKARKTCSCGESFSV